MHTTSPSVTELSLLTVEAENYSALAPLSLLGLRGQPLEPGLRYSSMTVTGSHHLSEGTLRSPAPEAELALDE